MQPGGKGGVGTAAAPTAAGRNRTTPPIRAPRRGRSLFSRFIYFFFFFVLMMGGGV